MSSPSSKGDKVKSRLLVFFLGIPALLGIIWLGGWVYALFATAVVILGLQEYLTLLRRGKLTPRPIPVYLTALAILVAFTYHVGLFGQRQPWETLGWQFFAIVFLLVIMIQTLEVLRSTGTAWLNLSANVLGVLWVAGFGGSFILVRSADFSAYNTSVDVAFRLTLSLYVTVWICDTLAYLVGRRFGKKKILPLVSPKKTVVGTVSGIIGALIAIFLLGTLGFLPREIFPVAYLFILGLIVGVGGQMGDFVESRLKRDFGVKDTGSLLPGHGGILDRFDSLLFVMPLAYLFLKLVMLL
ncbi:MAG: phosphatidate cytidylyltransferase [Candidatus Neomarinimicrobiota bacterium]